MKRIIITIIVIVLITCLFIFTRDKKEKNNNLIVSEVTHSVFYTPFYVAIENGYFKDEGINIELMLTQGADKVATSIISNSADVGLSGPEATVYVYNNSKQKLISFASLTKRDGQFIIGDCKYKNNFEMKDLIGKKILAGRSGGMPLMMFEYALKESGIDKKEVTIDRSVEFAGLSGAYIAHQGDFVNLFEPNATNLENQGYGCVLASLGNITGVVPYTTFYAKEEFINENKDLLKGFNKALNKGLKFVEDNNSKEIAEVIIKQFPDTKIDTLSTLIDRYKNADSWYKSTYVNKDDYYRLIDIMIYGKSIDKKLTIEMLMTNEFN